MSLPSTTTLNVGSPAADVIYNKGQNTGDTVEYIADSDQGDLTGRKTIKFAKNGVNESISRTLTQVKLPWYQDGEYKGHAQMNITVLRPPEMPNSFVDELYETGAELLTDADIREAIVESAF